MDNDEVTALYKFLTMMTNKTVVSLGKKLESIKGLTKIELLQELSNSYDDIVQKAGD